MQSIFTLAVCIRIGILPTSFPTAASFPESDLPCLTVNQRDRGPFLTRLVQSVANFGIPMRCGLVTALAPPPWRLSQAVKIDTFAYLPVQTLERLFDLHHLVNYGAGNKERICRGTKESFATVLIYSASRRSQILALPSRYRLCRFAAELRTADIIARRPLSLVTGGRVLFWNRLPVLAFTDIMERTKRAEMFPALTVISSEPV